MTDLVHELAMRDRWVVLGLERNPSRFGVARLTLGKGNDRVYVSIDRDELRRLAMAALEAMEP